ncbi:MAG TPA: class I SAM-dependent methyltransferase [Bacteroidales bacterium]|jgi:ubiquinone/menaquinone biosynthesis C-methylase UbiE|nr:class I SAM-dependent methyltransferase [Bacteroidales bacterium]HOU97587.1 class I SAM-dependent methyltransferase [Bacteroidales bacterium]
MEKANQINDEKVKEHFNKVASYHGNDNAVLDSSLNNKSRHDNIYHHYSTLRSVKLNIEKDKNKVILDFGCGTGRFFSFMSKSFKKLIATDASEEMLKISIERAKNYNNVEVIPYEDFFNKDIHVDVVYTFWVLAHCSDTQIKIIFKKLYKILNNKGNLYIFEQISKNGRYLSDVHYQRSIDDYIQLAKEFGFVFEKTKNLIRYPSYARSIWKKLPSWCRFLMPVLYYVEKKTVNRKPEFIDYHTSLILFRKE